MAPDGATRRSALSLLVCWGGLIVVMLTGERLFLLAKAGDDIVTFTEVPHILGRGLVSDSATALAVLLLSFPLALLFSLLFHVAGRGRPLCHDLHRGAVVALTALATGVGIVLVMDVAYYTFNRQHLDFVFFEYLVDLVRAALRPDDASQAVQQTGAELHSQGKWVASIGVFLSLEALLLVGWWQLVHRVLMPSWHPWTLQRLAETRAIGALTVIIAMLGAGTLHLLHTTFASPPRDALFTLASNPILSGRDAFIDVAWSPWVPRSLPEAIAQEEALRTVQDALGGAFDSTNYPVVRRVQTNPAGSSVQPVNIVLLFVEGLDRRFVGRHVTVRSSAAPNQPTSIALTPFLDRWAQEAVSFPRFFSNGVQTMRGLFSTLCSYSRHGNAVSKSRNDRGYLCLPEVLRQAGYRAEMAVAIEADLTGLRPFLMTHGFERVYTDQDYATHARRLGVGLSDQALFEFLHHRLDVLQRRRRRSSSQP